MKKILLSLVIIGLNSFIFAGSKVGIDFKIGTGYMDTVRTEYINSKYEINSLSTFVIGGGIEFYDRANLYIGSDIEFAMIDDQYTNATGYLTTIFGKVGFHIEKTIILYALGGYSHQNIYTETTNTNGNGYVYGGGIKFNHRQNIGAEVNLKRSQLVDDFDNEYVVSSMTVNWILFF